MDLSGLKHLQQEDTISENAGKKDKLFPCFFFEPVEEKVSQFDTNLGVN